MDWLCFNADAQRFGCPWCKTKNCWCSVEADFYEVVAISSLPFVHIMAANTSVIAWCSRKAVWLSKMQEQQLLTLHWHSFLSDSSDVDASIFGLQGSQYFDYVSQQPCLLFNYQTHKTKNHWCIVDAHFQDGSTSVSLSFLRIKTANPITLEGCDHAAVWLPKIWDQKSLTDIFTRC